MDTEGGLNGLMMMKGGMVVKRRGGEENCKLNDDMPSTSEPNDMLFLDELLGAKLNGDSVSGAGYTNEAIDAFISEMENDDMQLEMPKLPYDQSWSSYQIENPHTGSERLDDLLQEVESQLILQFGSSDQMKEHHCGVDFFMLGDDGGADVLAVDDGDYLFLSDLAM